MTFKLTPSSLIGSRLVAFGHSYMGAGGVSGDVNVRAWHNHLAGMLRGHLWNQGVGGAIAAKTALNRGTNGWGGVQQVLQGLLPNPYTGINWRGAYSAAGNYAPGDGVSSGGNWYVNGGSANINNVAPPGGNWVQVTTTGQQAASPEHAVPTYLPLPRIPIIWYGGDDLPVVYQGNDQPFLTAMETILAHLSCSAVYDANSPMIAYSAGLSNAANNYSGRLSSIEIIPNTSGATITFNTPADWPGGYVDFLFVAVPGGTGAFAFTVDGVATNVINSGTTNSNIVNIGSPNRSHYDSTSLTAALTAGVAVTALPVVPILTAVTSGDTIVVGTGANLDTFTASGAAAVNAVSIPVTSHAPTYNHAVGDSVYDNYAGRWGSNADITVRVPTNAGSHSVVATVQASPAVASVYFGGVGLESPTPPPILVPSLFYVPDYAAVSVWTNRQANDAMVDSWNTDLQTLCSQFAGAHYFDTTTLLRQGAKLTTALAANQAGVTSLQVDSLPYAVAANDYIEIGSGTTRQEVQASGAAAAGATTIPVTSFTSTYAQPVGTAVWDSTVLQPYFAGDNVHPSNLGHEKIAGAFYNALINATEGQSSQQMARFAAPIGEPVAFQRINNGNLVVGSNTTAGAWTRVTATTYPSLFIPAEPGDLLEVTLAGIWNTVTGESGNLDIVTFNYYAGMPPINYFSGCTFAGNSGTSGVGGDAVGAQLSNGLAPLLFSGVASLYEPCVGTFHYITQYADIVSGGVYLALYGKSSTTTQLNILASGGNSFIWSVKNKGPMSNAAQAS